MNIADDRRNATLSKFFLGLIGPALIGCASGLSSAYITVSILDYRMGVVERHQKLDDEFQKEAREAIEALKRENAETRLRHAIEDMRNFNNAGSFNNGAAPR